MAKRTKWRPARDELIAAFGELAMRVRALNYPSWERDIVINLCYARRDLQLALVGYDAGPQQPIKKGDDDACTDLCEMPS